MACEECSRNCQLVHWKKNDLSSSVVRFIRIMIGDDVNEVMRLPRKFAKTILHLVGKETKVEDSTGAQWIVTLSIHKGVLSFHKGWSKFAADHMLQEGEFLVFNQLKKGHFVVQVYDTTCTERTDFSNKICTVKRARTTEKIASKATLSQANATNDVIFDNVWQPNKKARASGVPSRNVLEMGTGDGVKDDASATNQESSSTSTPVVPNFEDHLDQPETSHGPQKSEIGNKEKLFLDDACCIIDRGSCYAETDKGTVLCDLSVFEIHKNEYISSTRCINGDEDIHTHAQTNVASRAEANLFEGSKPESAFNACASKVDQTNMIQNKKGFEPVDKMPVECKKVLSDKYGLSHRTSVKLAEKCSTADSISKDPRENAKQSKENSGNCHDSQVCNEYDSALPRQGMAVNSKVVNHTSNVVKKELVQLRSEASDHAQKSKGADLKQSSMKEGNTSSKSRIKLEAVEMDLARMSKGPDLKQSSMKVGGTSSKPKLKLEEVEMDPEYSLHVSASVSAKISCLAVTDDRDFIELPSNLPSVTFRKARGREDNKCGVLLLDPKRRRWPAIYYEKSGFCILICGWKRFNEANNAGPGDTYIFSLEDESQCLYKVDVVPESRDSER